MPANKKAPAPKAKMNYIPPTTNILMAAAGAGLGFAASHYLMPTDSPPKTSGVHPGLVNLGKSAGKAPLKGATLAAPVAVVAPAAPPAAAAPAPIPAAAPAPAAAPHAVTPGAKHPHTPPATAAAAPAKHQHSHLQSVEFISEAHTLISASRPQQELKIVQLANHVAEAEGLSSQESLRLRVRQLIEEYCAQLDIAAVDKEKLNQVVEDVFAPAPTDA